MNLPAQLRSADERLRPATLEEMKIIFARELVAGHFRGRPASWQLTMPLYVEDLGHLPPDLLQEGIRRCRRAAAWFPTTSEILAAVRDDMERRIEEHDRLRAEAAEQKRLPAPARQRVTPEQIAETLARYGIKRMPEAERPKAHARYVEDSVPS